MLSFFGKKKPSPETPPEEVIPSAQPSSNNTGDDFIFVEQREPGNDPTAVTQSQPAPVMYPPMPPNVYGLPYPGVAPAAQGSNISTAPISYVQGVPFELAPQLCSKSVFDVTQLQVDGILAVMTRQMSVDEQLDYDFNLERAVQSECY